MRVELLDYTGAGSTIGDTYAANVLIYAKNTRLSAEERSKLSRGMTPEQRAAELLAISKTIRSSWEFVNYTFEITGVTRACADQILRTRTGSYAVQSLRSVDVGHFDTKMPESIKNDEVTAGSWSHLMDIINSIYRGYKIRGIPSQDARGILPMNILTNLIAGFNLRTLADLAGKRDNLRAQGEYTEVYRMMAERAMEVHPWVKDFLYPERTKTPALDAILRERLGDRAPVDDPLLNDALKEVDALKGVWG